MERGGENDRFGDHVFRDGNRIRFEAPVDEAAKDWWRRRFLHGLGLTPEDVGDLLSRSWAGEKRMTVTQFDGVAERFSLRVEGSFGDGDFWFHSRTLDMHGAVINADRMFISASRRGQGLGRRFMRDLLDFARKVGISKVRLDAEQIGRYAWLRVGFVPDRGSWGRLKVELTQRLAAALPDIGNDRFLELLAVVQRPDPEAARELAGLRDPVSSVELWETDGRASKIPLGRALFLEVGSNWSGELDLDDRTTLGLVDSYVSGDDP